MSNSTRPRPLTVCLLTLLVAFSLTGLATSEDNNEDSNTENAWDQAAVTKLAPELEQTLREAYEQSLKAPPQQTALQQRERDAAQGVIRRARDLAVDYARKMRAGWDRGAVRLRHTCRP